MRFQTEKALVLLPFEFTYQPSREEFKGLPFIVALRRPNINPLRLPFPEF